jgi:uridine kinase
MYIIGIAGGSGSGKTTFAEKIIKEVAGSDVALVHQDNYYLDRLPKDSFIDGQPNFDSPLAFDWKLFRRHLDLLKKGKRIKGPIYDFERSRRSKETSQIGPSKVILVEGILALWDEEIRENMDLKVYLKVEADIRFIRRLHRDVSDRKRELDDIIAQYYRTVRPMHLRYIQPTQQHADIIIGEHHDRAVEVIVHEIAMRLRKSR